MKRFITQKSKIGITLMVVLLLNCLIVTALIAQGRIDFHAGGLPLHFDRWLSARNGSQVEVPVLKLNSSENTILNAKSGGSIGLSIAETAEVSVSNDTLTFSGATAEIVPGATSLSFRNNADAATNLGIADAGAITLRSTLTSSATGNFGWSLVSGANAACNTTCTSACVFGQNTATFALVDCADATADVCICAGAS